MEKMVKKWGLELSMIQIGEYRSFLLSDIKMEGGKMHNRTI